MSEAFQLENDGLFPTSGLGNVHHARKIAQGKMHKKRELSSHSVTLPKFRQVAQAVRITEKFMGLTYNSKDTLSRNEEAARNCTILAAEEASNLKPNLYTQEELEVTQSVLMLRAMGISTKREPQF
jgi:hypothetical protein